jgi:hypothetical protein
MHQNVAYQNFWQITWIITFLSVVLIDVDWGLLIGILTSIWLVVIKDQLLKLRQLNQNETSKTYFDKKILTKEVTFELFYLMAFTI